MLSSLRGISPRTIEAIQNSPVVVLKEEMGSSTVPFVGHDHVVQFYEDDDFLCERVAEFLVNGLSIDQPVVVIATRPHQQGIRDRLRMRLPDYETKCSDGRIIFLDAHETLREFMRGELPDPELFAKCMGAVLQKALLGNEKGHVRAFGEMVDVLWREGNRRAVVRLEELWNDLAVQYPFSLLCGYVMDDFRERSDDEAFADVCHAHLRVVPCDRYATIDEPEARRREICRLQQRTHALESELRAREHVEKELRGFLENAAEGIHSVARDGTIIWANRAELELLGYSADEYIGRHLSEFYVDRSVLDDVLARLSANETLCGYEARLRAKDGSIKHVLINSNVYQRDGELIHTRCFTRDITERKRAEEVNAGLFEEAKTAVTARDHVLAVVSHDLRNHLNSLLISAVMVRSLAGARDETRSFRRPAEIIVRSANRMTRLIEDLLDFDSIEHGRLKIHQEILDPITVLDEIVDRHSSLAEERGVVVIKGECDGIKVCGDRDRILQVLDNLITNALNVTPPNGHIRVQVARAASGVVFSVKDTGPGIQPDQLAHLFERYWRGEGVDYVGHGLGLAIARGIAEAHGGRIWAESVVGHGSTFFVELPSVS